MGGEYHKWDVDLPEEIFVEYRDEGASVCGSAKDIIEEISEDMNIEIAIK
jgi:hypothetical protein